ncbi:BQ5605_C008g05347 [Microbotryum silenes-dioicae]|uniref:BQ5605_C008g05347 protein n=1 Tax=Microbotryum silenes-dioicae TaxID=796604 RepID=A0A2X0N6R4_9BASI|nr:BQ5605_C008g05347 [Microbotryum silenes-dioicae]
MATDDHISLVVAIGVERIIVTTTATTVVPIITILLILVGIIIIIIIRNDHSTDSPFFMSSGWRVALRVAGLVPIYAMDLLEPITETEFEGLRASIQESKGRLVSL